VGPRRGGSALARAQPPDSRRPSAPMRNAPTIRRGPLTGRLPPNRRRTVDETPPAKDSTVSQFVFPPPSPAAAPSGDVRAFSSPPDFLCGAQLRSACQGDGCRCRPGGAFLFHESLRALRAVRIDDPLSPRDQ
jgi:hypothetical protein